MGIDMRRLQENSADNSEDLENSAGGDSAGSAENEQLDFIMKSGSVISKKDGETIHCLTKYEHIIPLLVSIEQSDEIDGLLLVLNTMGGDVEAGLAIAEMIAGMTKPTVSLVLGGGHSIGVPLAVCAKKSFIVPSATMTIHPVRMTGMVIGAPQTFRYLLQSIPK